MSGRRFSISIRFAAIVALIVGSSDAVAQADTAAAAPTGGARPTVAYAHLALPGGQWARVFSDGLAEVYTRDESQVKMVQLPLLDPDGATSPLGNGARQLPGRGAVIADLLRSGQQAYVAHQVVVVYRSGATAPSARIVNQLGVDHTRRVFTGTGRTRLAAMRTAAQAALGRNLLDFPDAQVLHVTGASVPDAVNRLRASPDVAYAAPNWRVTTSDTPPTPVSAAALRAATRTQQSAARSAALSASGLPDNYALTSSAQSLLNRPATDVVPAYTALAKHGQLPGQGEVITNVSLGDLTDASAAADPADPCNFYAANYGPTTIVQGGQRYIDWPSMPLIPTYTSDANGAVDPTGETCGQDPNLTEVGLDFSMMAPLPHDQQRADAVGSGLTDLLGIAPGADYRLVIPHTAGGAVTDVDAAFLAAATQTPKPDVITASLSFGLDAYGFPSRYLEEDPMSQALLTSIVHGAGIVVCVSSNDGLRTATNAAVPPSGGSVDTDVATPGQQPTDINDLVFSTARSLVRDSGTIDVGGSTLNDIFAAPPQDPRNAQLKAQQAFPTTRYTGGRLYSSGIGSRVDVSAPGDNVVSLAHPFGGAATAVQVLNEGGTSASAPEVAAAAAVVLQVARLTHDTRLTRDPVAVRSFLAQTGTPLPAVPQSDLPLDVGPQVDVGNAVETLFARAGETSQPDVARVAVAQRQQASALGGTIQTATDPANVSLTGRLVDAWITVAPDWIGVPRHGVTYQLSADTGPHQVLAATPWARVQPRDILAAAGLPLVSTTARTVPLVYTARSDGALLASVHTALTLGPTDGSRPSVPAPLVAPVVRGATMRVSYDISNLVGATNPTLVVSQPGRVESATGLFFRPSYTVPLSAPTGSIDVPVAALPGAGIYGVGIQDAPGGWASRNDSAFAFTRVAPAGDSQPAVPLVAAGGSAPAHYAEFPYGGSFNVSFDVRAVSHADGAVIEISAPGPTPFNDYNPFNNPNGSQRDANGHDTGSVAYVRLGASHGTVTLNGGALGLDPTMNHVVRVLATRAGRVIGEASGVSSISMDGVRAADGGNVANGFGVNANGDDGFITSDQLTADGALLGSVETFSQKSAAITSTVVSSGHLYGTLNGGCPGMFHRDVGLYDDVDTAAQSDTLRVLNPVTSGGDGGTWTPPGTPICLAQNQDTNDTAVLTQQDGSTPTLNVVTSDIAAGTFGTPVDLTPGLDPAALSIAGGIGQDTGLNQALVPVVDAFAPNSPGRLVTVDLGTGQVSSSPSVTDFFASGVAVDSSTHTAVVPSNDNYGIYDLTGHTATAITNGGSGYQHVAADGAHHLFVMQEVAPPDYFGTSPNNNAMSSVVVVDEHGNLVRRVEQFNFFNIFLLDMGSYVQLNPGTGTAFTLAPGGAQLQPFSYRTGG
ncbi:MAG TPA: S8 family serine peptidase [Jatrophihabitans sp.]|nr:S8 family serine peptidase [Jatrophihabitans sp.]